MDNGWVPLVIQGVTGLVGVIVGGLITRWGETEDRRHERELREEDRRHEREHREEDARLRREQDRADAQVQTLRELQDVLAEVIPSLTESAMVIGVANQQADMESLWWKFGEAKRNRQAVQGRLFKLLTRVQDDQVRVAAYEVFKADIAVEEKTTAEMQEDFQALSFLIVKAQARIGDLLRAPGLPSPSQLSSATSAAMSPATSRRESS